MALKGFAMKVTAILLASSFFLTFPITFPTEAQTGPDPAYVLRLTSATGLPGESVEISVILDFPNGQNVIAVLMGVCASRKISGRRTSRVTSRNANERAVS